MQARRRSLLIASSCAALAGPLLGCASRPAPTVRTYTEKVSSLLLSQDGKQMVVLGEQYHYVFDAPADIVTLMPSPLKTSVVAVIDPFTVSADGSVHGTYMLVFQREVMPPDADLLALGFARDADGRWVIHGALAGKRYLIGNTLKQWRQKEDLHQTYVVTVRDEQSPADRAADKMLTPVALSTGGVLMVYFVLLAPILIPLMFLTEEKRGPISQTFR